MVWFNVPGMDLSCTLLDMVDPYPNYEGGGSGPPISRENNLRCQILGALPPWFQLSLCA